MELRIWKFAFICLSTSMENNQKKKNSQESKLIYPNLPQQWIWPKPGYSKVFFTYLEAGKLNKEKAVNQLKRGLQIDHSTQILFL